MQEEVAEESPPRACCGHQPGLCRASSLGPQRRLVWPPAVREGLSFAELGRAGRRSCPHLCLLCEPTIPAPAESQIVPSILHALDLQIISVSEKLLQRSWKSFGFFNFWCNILTFLFLPNLNREEQPQFLHCFFGR